MNKKHFNIDNIIGTIILSFGVFSTFINHLSIKMRALIRLFDAMWLNQTISTHNEYLHELIITILNELLDIFMVLNKIFHEL